MRASIAADLILNLIATLLKLDQGTTEFGGCIPDHLGEGTDIIRIVCDRRAKAEDVVSDLVIVPLGLLPATVESKRCTLSRSNVLALGRGCKL